MDANTIYLSDYLYKMDKQDKKQDEVEVMAIDIFNQSIEELHLDHSTLNPIPGWNAFSAINDIERKHWVPIAMALQAKDSNLLGKIIMKATFESMMKEARCEAEDKLDD